MTTPHCPEHGRLILDLALGVLDDERAAAAENIRSSCPNCGEWYRSRFEGAVARRVDSAVAAALDEIVLPTRRRGSRWMAAAAVAVMTLGAGALWLARDPVATPPTAADPVAVERVAAIGSFDFESPEAFVRVVPPAVPDGDDSPPRVVVPVQVEPDTGDASGDADAGEIVIPTPAESEPLFAGGFESGDLGGWVPST